MAATKIEHDAFEAIFPGEVEVQEDNSDPNQRRIEFTTELDPVGVFAVRVTVMPISAFMAVGADTWLTKFGDFRISQLQPLGAELLDDQRSEASPEVHIRHFVARLHDADDCGFFARTIAVVDGVEGRIIEASAAVEWAESWEDRAYEFLGSLRVVSSPALQS